jgi:hypothetical protein
MRTRQLFRWPLVFWLMIGGLPGFAGPQQVPQSLGLIVRNDTTTAVTIEYHSAGDWKSISLAARGESLIAGDRIRVATTRDDKATVTIDLPIQPGGKYRLVWNKDCGLWDFSNAS